MEKVVPSRLRFSLHNSLKIIQVVVVTTDVVHQVKLDATAEQMSTNVGQEKELCVTLSLCGNIAIPVYITQSIRGSVVPKIYLCLSKREVRNNNRSDKDT